MNSAQEIEAILQDVFEDVALLFGAAAYRLRNEHVWAVKRQFFFPLSDN